MKSRAMARRAEVKQPRTCEHCASNFAHGPCRRHSPFASASAGPELGSPTAFTSAAAGPELGTAAAASAADGSATPASACESNPHQSRPEPDSCHGGGARPNSLTLLRFAGESASASAGGAVSGDADAARFPPRLPPLPRPLPRPLPPPPPGEAEDARVSTMAAGQSPATRISLSGKGKEMEAEASVDSPFSAAARYFPFLFFFFFFSPFERKNGGAK